MSSAYFPPGLDVSCYVDYITILEDSFNQLNNPSCIIAGDFNLPKISWYSLQNEMSTFLPNEGVKASTFEIANVLYDCFKKIGLWQKNFFVNSSNNILDSSFTNLKNSNVSLPIDYLLNPDSYHPVLEFEFETNLTDNFKIKITFSILTTQI